MKKNIFKSSLIISAICALFSLSVFSYDQKKTMPVKADSEGIVYDFDYRYQIDKYMVPFYANTIGVYGNDFYGSETLGHWSYRIVCDYGEGNYKLRFSELSIGDLYWKYVNKLTLGNDASYIRYEDQQYNIFLNDVTFDYFNNLGALRNINNVLDCSLRFKINQERTSILFFLDVVINGIFSGEIQFDYMPMSIFTTDAALLNAGREISVPLISINPIETVARIYDAIEVAFDDGVSGGYEEAWNNGYIQGKDDGYSLGYSDGYSEGTEVDETAATIFSGILQISMVPVNFFLSIFNFEILGINVSSFVSALLTIAVTVIIIRIITGKKDG